MPPAMTFSAALCRGLIEAVASTCNALWPGFGFPRLYAAASLKPRERDAPDMEQHAGFPRLYAAASLKPIDRNPVFASR